MGIPNGLGLHPGLESKGLNASMGMPLLWGLASGLASPCFKPYQYGFPLSKKCVVDEARQAPMEVEVESDSGFDWKVILMGYGCGLVIGLSMGCLIFSTGKPKWFVRMVEKDRRKKVKRSTRSTRNHGARRILAVSICDVVFLW